MEQKSQSNESNEKVRDVMHRDIHWITADKNLCDAAQMMKTFNIGALPVMDQDRPVGFLTDRDIAIRCVAGRKNPDSTSVFECMSSEVYVVSEEDSLEEACRLMCDHHVRRLMVCDGQNRPTGILTMNHISFTHNDRLISDTIDSFYGNASV